MSIIGKKKELQERKIGGKKAKQAQPYFDEYIFTRTFV